LLTAAQSLFIMMVAAMLDALSAGWNRIIHTFFCTHFHTSNQNTKNHHHHTHTQGQFERALSRFGAGPVATRTDVQL
jgi:hypothetical protein